MYYENYQPYYKMHSDPEFSAMEAVQEQEWERMTDYYSDVSRQIFAAVVTCCQQLDYEGSFIFDECPDVDTLWRYVREIREKVQSQMSKDSISDQELTVQARSRDFLDDLIQVLLLQEISRRRCRNHRCNHQENKRPPHHNPGHRPPMR